ncbi:MAG TPA: tetratricopeptide repeat protein [Pyrinomonadaceae bacterium]
MSKRKTSSLLFSLVLTLSILAPHAVLGRPLSDANATATSDAAAPARAAEGRDAASAEAAAETASAADEAQKPKRKGNSFARSLAAPFRALARLFGGGKSKAETAKKPAPTPETTANATQSIKKAEAAQNSAPEESKLGKGDAAAPTAQTSAPTQAAPVEAARIEPLSKTPAREATGSAQSGRESAAEGVRIVRPSAGEVVRELQPKMWIPKIVGVPSDAVSQGRALLQHGYVQEAIAELQTAATTGLPEQLAEANNLPGLAYDRLGWHRQAAEAYERALSASPKDYVALTNLGYSLYLADDYNGALKRLKQAAKLAPSEPVIFNNLGVVNAKLGRYGEAYKNFARGSGEYDAHLKLAGILEDQRRDKEAVKHYEAALRLQPGANAVIERLVALYERTGARDKADTARRALGQPKNPQKTTTGGGG